MGQAMPMWGQGKSPLVFVANLIQENNEEFPEWLDPLLTVMAPGIWLLN